MKAYLDDILKGRIIKIELNGTSLACNTQRFRLFKNTIPRILDLSE